MVEVKLLGYWGSPFSRRVEIALKLKGVEYEYIEEDLSNKSPLLLQYNPVHKKIPVLVHKEKPIAESLVILEYIDETWKNNPVLPQDPYERAMARFWAKFIEEQCMGTLWKVFWSQGKDREESTREALEHLKTLENELKDKRFFGGEKIGFVDIVANFIGFWLGAIQEASGSGFMVLTEEKFPRLCKWAEEYVNCSVIKEHLPPREKLITHLRTRFEVSK